MTERKIRVFCDLDDLFSYTENWVKARDILKQFTAENKFNGCFWFDQDSSDGFLGEDEEIVNIIADYFDGTYETSCITGFYDPAGDKYDNLYYLSIEM